MEKQLLIKCLEAALTVLKEEPAEEATQTPIQTPVSTCSVLVENPDDVIVPTEYDAPLYTRSELKQKAVDIRKKGVDAAGIIREVGGQNATITSLPESKFNELMKRFEEAC